MKAIRLYAPGDLRIEDVPIPVPEEGEALVKVMAVGICGSDIPRVNQYGAHISPITIGHEFAGEIVELGSEAAGFEVGDHVTCAPLIPCGSCDMCKCGQYSLCEHYDYYGSRRDGAMAEYVAVRLENLIKVSADMPFETAAAADPCANAMHALSRARFKEGETLAVFGAGPIGLLAIACAKVMGARKIFAIDVWDEKLRLAKKIGAAEIINSNSINPIDAILSVTNGRGVDVAIDFSGVPVVQEGPILSCARLGRVVYLGISHAGLNLGEKAVDRILRYQLDVRGSWNSFTAPFPGPDWTKSIELFESGAVSARNIISHWLKLDDAPGIFEQIRNGNLFYNKIMFFPN